MVGNIIQITAGTNFTVGWYEIVSVSVGVSITLDRNCTSGVGASGTGNVGGAFAFGGSNEDAFFETFTAGNTWYMKTGTHTPGAAISISAAGGASNPIKGFGYNAARGDAPTGSTRPVIATAANGFTFGANWVFSYLQFTGTAANLLATGNNCQAYYCKGINSSATANRTGIALGNANVLWACEFVSYRGRAISASAGISTVVIGCYLHDSDMGAIVGSGGTIIEDTIVSDNVTFGIDFSAANTGSNFLNGITLYGAENKLGIGLNMVTGVTNVRLTNSVIYGFVTGVTHADTQSICYDNFNDYFNNTSDVSAAGQWQKGTGDIALNPTFTNVAQITGSTATTTAGNHLVQAAATFVTSGVVAGRDYVYIKSGTGVTAGKYGILSVDSETQITTDITLSADATANKVWQITTGQNFAVGTNLKATGYPGAFPAALTTGYIDIGAAQRQESGGTTAHGFVG